MDDLPELIATLIHDHRRFEVVAAQTGQRLTAALTPDHDAALVRDAAAAVQGLQRLLEHEVALHIAKEEQILFPAVRERVQGITSLLDDMLAEHDEVRARKEALGRTLEQLDDDHTLLHQAARTLDEATGRPEYPGLALEAAVLQQLSDTVRHLDWLLQGHFTGEEDGIFLPAEELLSTETFTELARRSVALESSWNAAREDRRSRAEQRRSAGRISSLPAFPLPEGLATTRTWRLTVAGLVQSPLALDLGAVRSLPAATLAADFACEEGWVVPGLRWRGVPLQEILELAGVQPDARYLAVGSGDFVAVLPLASVREGAPLLAYELDEAPLVREHGGPLRLVAADVACYQSVKWVDRLELLATPPEETAKRIAVERTTRR